jgi:hypothetical protein
VLQGLIVMVPQKEEEAMHAQGPIVAVDDEGPDGKSHVPPLVSSSPFLFSSEM